MTAFVDVCALADIPNGRHLAVVVEWRPILILRVNADLYAIENRCSHLDFPLAGGRQIGCEIICRQHGARFNIGTGQVVGGPAVHPVPTFAVRRAGDRVEVCISVT